ncbi:MAG TPA: hybrid sensor histidine kinase/response regulator [Candidatus Binatia bacterium]
MAAKIVVIDDSRTQRSTIALALERQGYQVVQGSNGLEALHLVHGENPDLLVSDIVMPELTGYQVCRLLKNDPATEDLPIILLTTLDHREHHFWGKEAGADSYVLKDADAAPLEQEVARLLREKKRKPGGGPSKSAIPFARQTAHARLTDLLDRLLFEATISNRIRETGRSGGDLAGVLDDFFKFFHSLIDYQICLLSLRAPSGPLVYVHLGEPTPAALLEAARQSVREEAPAPAEREKAKEIILNPEMAVAGEAEEKPELAMLSARFSNEEGGLAVFTANRLIYTEETSQTLRLAARELEPILSASSQAAALDKLKADFTAMIVHDLRSPLTAIMSAGAIIEDGLVGPVNAAQKTWLEKIGASSRKLLNLINDFLDLSKIEAGRLDLLKTETDLAPLVRANLDDYAVLAREKKISLTSRLEGPVLKAPADRERLGQVFNNLISNAIKFTPEGGTIEIGAARHNEKEITLWVRDSGVGIPAAEIGDLFEKYRQTRSGRVSKHKGTGLGLAICKMIVESHGGRIWAESAEGKGSTFFFTLPLEDKS